MSVATPTRQDAFVTYTCCHRSWACSCLLPLPAGQHTGKMFIHACLFLHAGNLPNRQQPMLVCSP